MFRRIDRRSFVLMTVMAAMMGTSARADDGEHDQDMARKAVEAGKVLPLGQILESLRGQLGGDVVGVELKRQRGGFVYELKVVTPAGHLREITVDAATGTILHSEGD